MRELNVKEIKKVSGGNPWAWAALGYVGGKIMDGFLSDISTGHADDKTLTRRGYR